MAGNRILSLVLLCFARASCNTDGCASDGSGTCQDVTGLLQGKMQVESSVDEEGDRGQMRAVEPPITAIENDEDLAAVLGSSSTCGAGEEVVSTDCLGSSVVKEQARATVRMMMGGSCCTAWLVKSATQSEGALMLTTGHCANSASASFQFNYARQCPEGPASTPQSCTGNRVSAEITKDEQGIYELDRSCPYVSGVTPILLDIGRPDADEGMYIIGHPNCRPQLLSHQEPHDDGHHCEVRQIFTRGGSTRISYYCDTQGGNSGSPVFSARTGYAFAIHSHGGCRGNQASANSGGLLENAGIVQAFQQFGIPFVRRDNSLFKYEVFQQQTQCPDFAAFVDLNQKSLAECKKLCVGSLTCVGIEYSPSAQTCSVNYRSQTTSSSCKGDAQYFLRPNTLTTSLVHPTPAPTPPPPAPGTCTFESMGLPECSMWSNAQGDQFDWSRASSTPSSGTGPSKANSGTYFMYIETSAPRSPNDKAIFRSTPVQLSNGGFLAFNYHMYGSAIGELKVEVAQAGSSAFTTVWSKNGAQGNQWIYEKVSLSNFDGQNVQLQFLGVRGSNWPGDIALDDVLLEKGGGGGGPTTVPPTQPPTAAPTTVPPTQPPTAAPTTVPPTQPPTTAAPTTVPPTQPPTAAPTTVLPTQPPTTVAPEPEPEPEPEPQTTVAPTAIPPTQPPTTDLSKKLDEMNAKADALIKLLQQLLQQN